MQAIKEILDEYPKTFSQLDLKTTEEHLIKSNARGFETATAKLKFLENINRQEWKPDDVTEREAIVNSMTVHEIRKIAASNLNTNQMHWFVVGDAETQLDRLEELGYGAPVLISQ
jgi:zinc protease